MHPTTASGVWQHLATKHTNVKERAERYAELTIPNIMLEDGEKPEDAENQGLTFGAKCVNSIVNKMMIAMFSPNRPAMRLDMTAKDKAELSDKIGLTVEDVTAALSTGEQEAMKYMDLMAIRPKLYYMMRLLVVTGNALLDLRAELPRIHSLRTFRVKRTRNQDVHTIITKEHIHFDELADDVQQEAARHKTEGKVDFYEWVRRLPDGRYEITQWVNDTKLSDKFVSIVNKDDLKLYPIPWVLADGADYGSGMLEEHAEGFESLAALNQSIVDGAVAGCEVRGLVNPAGITKVSDMKDSENGDWVPGTPADIAGFSFANAQNIQQAQVISDTIKRDLGAAFLLQSAITRDAERVTAEEIRLQAMELETSLGGTYSSLAVWFQRPLCLWLLDKSDFSIKGTKVKLAVITGLDALSRRGDLEKMIQAFNALASVNTLPPSVLDRLDADKLIAFVSQSIGVDVSAFFRNSEAQGKYMADRANAQAAANANNVAAETAAQNTGAMNG